MAPDKLENKVMHKTGIQRKIIYMICISALIVASVGLAIGYTNGYNLLRSTIGEEYLKMAQLLVISIERSVESQIEAIEMTVENPAVIEEIKKQNLKYEDLDKDEIEKYKKCDGENSKDVFITRGYLDPAVKEILEGLAYKRSWLKEVIITDKLGRVIDHSDIGMQSINLACQDWWQKTYAQGKGRIYLSDIKLDGPEKILVFFLAAPVKNDSGEVIGVCKAVIKGEDFFMFLQKFKIGMTGHAFLIDKDGRVIYRKDAPPLSKFEILGVRGQGNWVTGYYPLYKKRQFVALAPLRLPIFSENNLQWFIHISQDEDETFLPLKVLFGQLINVILLIFIAMIIIGVAFAQIFMIPIRKLHYATTKVAQGDLDYKVEIKTNDEFEEFADSFNWMISSLKTSTASLDRLNKEIVERRKAEEELKKTQDKLMRSEKLAVIGRLSAIVAHELKNPLGVMKNVAYHFRILGLGAEKNKKVEENLNILEEEIENSDKIITNLLEFSREKKPDLKSDSINIDIMESIEKIKIAPEIDIETELDTTLPLMLLDHSQIKEVIYNIVSNAVEAMKNGGKLTVKSYRINETFVEISFTDTGEGISAENLKNIFEPLFSTKPKGTGLGLAVCQSLVENHGGKIEVESQVGKGTVFKIILPIKI